MVAAEDAPTFDVLAAHASSALAAADNASIQRYLGAGERVGSLMSLSWKVCLGLLVLILVTWALGVLPGAVKFF